MERLERLLSDQAMGSLMQALGGMYLFGCTALLWLYHNYIGFMSAIGVTTGAILGLHGVCRLVIPICRRRPFWKHDK